MYKRFFKKIKYIKFIDNYPKTTLGSLIVAISCTFLIVIATFTQLPLGILTMTDEAFLHPVDFFSKINSLNDIMNIYHYIPQIPAILFIAALLGPRIGMIPVFLYIIAGLIGFPVFASGGGIGYFLQLGFGYILGYFVGVYVIGNILADKITSYSIVRGVIAGVIAIHLTGILYLTILMLIKHNSIFLIFGYIWAFSGMQIVYDMLISFLTVGLARTVRAVLWIAMD